VSALHGLVTLLADAALQRAQGPPFFRLGGAAAMDLRDSPPNLAELGSPLAAAIQRDDVFARSLMQERPHGPIKRGPVHIAAAQSPPCPRASGVLTCVWRRVAAV